MTIGRKGRRLLSREDRELWDGVTRSVEPLRKRRKKAEVVSDDEISVPAPPRTVSPRRVTAAPLSPKPKAPPSLAPLERKLKQKLRRGRADIDARIDLHGHTQAAAHDRLIRFLHVSQDKGAALVLVITGKGGKPGSGERGVLNRQVPLWLGLPELRSLVVGFDTASVAHGGEGALYVRLRKKRSLPDDD
jgi:DNA-nicking Smr family endonuclease